MSHHSPHASYAGSPCSHRKFLISTTPTRLPGTSQHIYLYLNNVQASTLYATSNRLKACRKPSPRTFCGESLDRRLALRRMHRAIVRGLSPQPQILQIPVVRNEEFELHTNSTAELRA